MNAPAPDVSRRLEVLERQVVWLTRTVGAPNGDDDEEQRRTVLARLRALEAAASASAARSAASGEETRWTSSH